MQFTAFFTATDESKDVTQVAVHIGGVDENIHVTRKVWKCYQ